MLKISFTTKLLKNSGLFIDVTENGRVCNSIGNNYKDKTVKRLPSKKSNRTIGYLTLNNRVTFTQLRQAFIKAPILQIFDLEYHIQIKTDMWGYIIRSVLSWLTNLGQWQSVAYYLQKMILDKTRNKTRNKTHDGKFLAIVKVFKIWQYYLEDCKPKALIFANYNNSCQFMYIKSLSFKQVFWAPELCKYNFWINYC